MTTRNQPPFRAETARGSRYDDDLARDVHGGHAAAFLGVVRRAVVT